VILHVSDEKFMCYCLLKSMNWLCYFCWKFSVWLLLCFCNWKLWFNNYWNQLYPTEIFSSRV